LLYTGWSLNRLAQANGQPVLKYISPCVHSGDRVWPIMLRRVAISESEVTALDSAAIPVLDVGAGRYIKSLLHSGR
jgi:hypothetical protein